MAECRYRIYKGQDALCIIRRASSLVHEYSARDDFYQSELKMEAASTGVTLHFPNQSPNPG